MTATELKNYVRATLIAQRTIAQEVLVFDELVDFITSSITTGIPAWTATLEFNTDGSDDGSFCTWPDTNGALRFWKTKTSANINNEPPTNPATTENTDWIEVSPSSGSSIKEWEAGIYGDGLVIVYHNHSIDGRALYILTEPTRPYESTNIETEITAGDWELIGGSGGATYFLGVYASLVALQFAHPTASPGEYAYVDTGIGSDIVTYIWDDDDADWVLSAGAPSDWTVASVNSAASKTTPADNDELGMLDSAASYILKKLTWFNLKATLKTYFDGIYATSGSVGIRPAIFDGMGSVILVGSKAYIRAKSGGTITSWSIIAEGTSPTCELNIKKIASGTALPSSSIVASDPPDLTTGNAVKSSSIIGWTTSVAPDDILEVSVTACANATKIIFDIYS